MAETGRYCKAYPVEMLTKFPGFKIDQSQAREEEDEKTGEKPGPREIKDDDILYMHEDLTVTDGIYTDENIVFKDDSEEWKAFCKDNLKFEIPDYIREMEEAEKKQLEEWRKEDEEKAKEAKMAEAEAGA